MSTCLVFAFASLIEFAIVNVWSRREARRAKNADMVSLKRALHNALPQPTNATTATATATAAATTTTATAQLQQGRLQQPVCDGRAVLLCTGTGTCSEVRVVMRTFPAVVVTL